MPILKIACEGAATIDISEIVPFQGDLKTMDPKEEVELRSEIENTGYAFPMNIWKLPDGSFPEGLKNLLGGHQRLTVLIKMRAEDWEVPPVPVNFVYAETPEMARQRVLQDVAQYGVVNHQGLIEFAALAKLQIADLETRFRLPDVDFEKLKINLAKLPEADRQEDGSVFTRTQEQYTGSIIKQMVLFFKAEDFPTIVARANKKLDKYAVQDYSELFLRLLNEDDRTDASTS